MADINLVLDTDEIIDAKDLKTVTVESAEKTITIEAGVGDYADVKGFKKITLTYTGE